MAAPSLDNEFMQYWSELTIVQKESLLSVAKNYVQLKQVEDVSTSRANLIEAERQAHFNGEGKTYSWEQVKEMALNKEKRNVL